MPMAASWGQDWAPGLTEREKQTLRVMTDHMNRPGAVTRALLQKSLQRDLALQEASRTEAGNLVATMIQEHKIGQEKAAGSLRLVDTQSDAPSSMHSVSQDIMPPMTGPFQWRKGDNAASDSLLPRS